MNDRIDVLAVDDNDEIRLLLRRGLGKRGLSVATCGDPAAAIAMAIESRPRVILLDVAMPGEDGFSLARRFHAEAATRNTPIVFLSALPLDETEIAGLEAGAQEVWQKGDLDLDELAERVRARLDDESGVEC